jgi:hypothetical protein
MVVACASSARTDTARVEAAAAAAMREARMVDSREVGGSSVRGPVDIAGHAPPLRRRFGFLFFQPIRFPGTVRFPGAARDSPTVLVIAPEPAQRQVTSVTTGS